MCLFVCVYLCVQLWAKSGHHGDLLNQGLLNDTSGWQKSHTNTHWLYYFSEDLVLPVYYCSKPLQTYSCSRATSDQTGTVCIASLNFRWGEL